MLELNHIYNMDCMEGMAQIPDKYFELAIIDPPYGIGASSMQMGKGKNKQWAHNKHWDNEKPNNQYFAELFRTSDRQIIWGGNYYDLPLTGGWIFWDKQREKDISFSDGELAWTSFLSVNKKAPIRYDGFIGADNVRIHPTQKPVALYKWLLKNYAKPGDKMLDTHMGSGSSIIACHDMGFEYMAFEIDKDYYEAAMKRISDHKAQIRMDIPIETVEQCSILGGQDNDHPRRIT